jgi:hypothetical protein
MYTTLLEDDTDTRFLSGLPTRSSLPSSYPKYPTLRLVENQSMPRRENFTAYVQGVSSSGKKEGFRENYSDYEIKLLNTSGLSNGSDYPTYSLETTNGVMSVIYTSSLNGTSSSYLEIDSTGHLIVPSLQGQSTGLVPLLVDANGKLVRGTLEDFEQIVSQLKTIHNQSHFTNLTL